MRPVHLAVALSLIACGANKDQTDPSTDLTDGTDASDDALTDAPTDPTDVSDLTDASRSELSFVAVACADEPRNDARFDDRRAPKMDAPDGEAGMVGGGLTVADLTGDGRLDILLFGDDEWQYFVGDLDDSFTERSASLAPGISLTEATAGTAADVDGDGDLDVLVTRHRERNVLLVNDGAGGLSDGTAASGLAGTSRRHMTSSFADFDGDGDLDAFVASFGGRTASRDVGLADSDPADPSYLFENRGDGTFADVSDRLPSEVHDAYTRVGTWLDVGGDPLPELIVVNDFGQARPTRLLDNLGGTFSIAAGTGLDRSLDGGGVAVGDVNADGLVDLAMSSTAAAALYLRAGDAWLDWGASRSFRASAEQIDGWGVALADFDNDADLDAAIAYGAWSAWDDSPEVQPDALLLQGSDGTFEDVAGAWGVAHPGIGRAVSAADLDDDGWPDLLTREIDAPTQMNLSRCGAESWLKVHLRDPGPNRFAIGARVTVRVGELAQSRWIQAGGTSMFVGDPPEALFGLADAGSVEELTVTWPDGAVETFRDVSARGELTIQRQP